MFAPRLPIAQPRWAFVSVSSVTGWGSAVRTTRPVAVYLLDQHVLGRILDGDTLVPVGNLDVVNPHVAAAHVDTVQTSLVTTAYDHVIHLSIGTLVKEEVELWC